MNRRPDAERRNRKTRATDRLPDWYLEAEFGWRKPPKRSPRQFLPLLPIAVFCIAVVLAVAVTVEDSRQHSPALESPKLQAFRWAVNRAMSAAELTQTARTQEEWQTVATWWEEAVDFMKSVPRSHERYQLAQEKIQEYQKNQQYAESQAAAQNLATLPSTNLWSVGSRRIDIIRIQGEPTQQVRYDALCQETLYYGNSTVEFNNGIAVKYDNVDRNLKAVTEGAAIAPPQYDYFWTIGSHRTEVFKIQGTPDRVTHYDSVRKETLYYGNSTIELTDDQVTGYSNLGQNLRVEMVAVPVGSQASTGFWTMGSERNDVFQVQGTPTQVTLDSSLCKETLHYEDSTVDLKNGFVTGYDNVGKNLRVRVQ